MVVNVGIIEGYIRMIIGVSLVSLGTHLLPLIFIPIGLILLYTSATSKCPINHVLRIDSDGAKENRFLSSFPRLNPEPIIAFSNIGEVLFANEPGSLFLGDIDNLKSFINISDNNIKEIIGNSSKETGNHVRRVAEYSRLLASLVGLDDEECELIRMASPMHDIGKVGIADEILLKPGKLTLDEFEIMKTHSDLGYSMLNHSTRPILKAAAIIARQHHEKWNGKGYPRGKVGAGIHIYGRITAIADVFDALGSKRVYKEAWKLDRILELLESEKGEHFDPDIVELFIGNLDQFLVIRDQFVD